MARFFSAFKKLFQKSKTENPNNITFKKRFNALKNLPEFFKQIWQTSPSMTLANAIIRLVRAVIPVSMMYIGKLIIDEVVRLYNTSGEGINDYLIGLIALEFILAIGSDVLNRMVSLLDSLLGDKFANESSVDLMTHAGKLDLEQYENAEFYDKLERARRQTTRRTDLMTQVLSQMQNLVTIISFVAGMALLNPWLILLLVVAVIPGFLGESYFNEKSYSLIRNWTPERRELDYYRYVGASDDTAKEVKLFGLSGFLTNHFKNLADKYYHANKKIATSRAAWGSLFAILASGGYYSAYIIIVMQAVTGQISVGDLTFLSGSFSRLRTLMENFLNQFSRIGEGALYLKDYFDFFHMQPGIQAPSNPRSFPNSIRRGITFENVSFRYSNSNQWAVKNLNFSLKAGEKLALVGENGAGKTTLVKLLARLYEPTEGRILLDGYDIREYDPEELRKNIGIIFQDFVRYQMTAAKNIGVGNVDQMDNVQKISHAAENSMAHQVIANLPYQYEQVIGRRFANGVNLSGGEWQKVAIARAYMRDAQILILDEPTSSLDARAEYQVFQQFTELTKGKTAVLISHRFSTVRMADRILVLTDGTIEEMGSHEALLDHGGKYAELFELQAKGYK